MNSKAVVMINMGPMRMLDITWTPHDRFSALTLSDDTLVLNMHCSRSMFHYHCSHSNHQYQDHSGQNSCALPGLLLTCKVLSEIV